MNSVFVPLMHISENCRKDTANGMRKSNKMSQKTRKKITHTNDVAIMKGKTRGGLREVYGRSESETSRASNSLFIGYRGW